MKKKKILKKLLPIIITIVVLISIISIFSIVKKDEENATPQLLRIQSYEDVQTGDEAVYDNNEKEITAIQFDAFFLTDKDGDGQAEGIRGTCNEVGSEANFYMDLKVIEEGQVKDAMVTINANNFYFNTAIVKDNVIAENYISSNTRTIKFNELSNGSQALLIGAVRAGDYSSSSSMTNAIGNDTAKYSKENTVTFSGTYVGTDGTERPFLKTIPFMVDWYGEVNAEITPKAQLIDDIDFNDLISEDGLTLEFDIKVEETKNQLIMAGSYLSGTIPQLNGYSPKSVKISGTNVTYEYNENTREFTAQREAIVNDSGNVTSNAYTLVDNTFDIFNIRKRINVFNFTIVYPIEAYESLGNTYKSFELLIPVEAFNKGYNNSNTEDRFQNPYTSDTDTGTVAITYKQPLGDQYLFDTYVGTYIRTPYDNYVVSKEKPINMYNGISLEETNDTYIVKWEAYTGVATKTNGFIMKERNNR